MTDDLLLRLRGRASVHSCCAFAAATGSPLQPLDELIASYREDVSLYSEAASELEALRAALADAEARAARASVVTKPVQARRPADLAAEIWAFVDSRRVGATCDEIEEGLDVSHQAASPRVTELLRKGDLVGTGTYRRTRAGRKAQVLVVRVDRLISPSGKADP